MSTPDDLSDEEFADLDDTDELGSLEEIDKIEDLAGKGAEDDDEDDTAADDEVEETTESTGEGDELDDDVPDEEEESLDVILAREQDLEEEFSQVSEAPRSSPATTPAGEDEFICRSCFLVKRRAQLADEDELICLDCA